ncbi:MAG: Ig-like domain repeat protein [Candidatus Sulfotelmatobacter sp.]
MRTSRVHNCLRIFALICLPAMTTSLWSQINVTTFHYDNARTGQNTQETVLTPENVNVNQFGKLFTISVDGLVYAQPLYMAGVQNIAGGTHNVLYIATEHDSVFALDADTGAILWQTTFINPSSGVTTVPNTAVPSCTAIAPEIGVTSTPVIDPSSGTLYLLAKTKENGQFVQRLHALDVTSGAEKFGGPAVIAAKVNGTGDGGQTVTFNPLQQLNRPGLLLDNGHVIIAWASNCDNPPYHGWVMSYSASTLAQEGVFNTSPNGAESGIWMSGDGVAADASGNYYFASGNGSYSGSASNNYGDSIVQLGPASNGSLPVLDWFTPWNQNALSGEDSDVGSAGVLLLPDLPAGLPHQQLLVQMGKEGTIYLVDRNSMGGYCSSCINIDTQIVQEINNASVGVWGSPAYWNGNVYWASNNDLGTASNLMAFSFNAGNSGLLSTAPTSQSSSIFGIGTGTPVVSANGTNDGIVWLLGNAASGAKCCQVLYAFDATDLSTLLYRSSQAAGNRDVPGGAVKFTAPVVANGKVYVGSQMQVSAYGLIATTKSTVTASANPGYVTQPITYTATVTGLNGTPTGSVVFYQGSTALATVPLSNGQATYSTTYATNGTNLISAAYSGAAGVSYPSTSPVLKEVVNLLPAVTTTKLTVAPTSIYVGQSVALTATVSSTFGTPPNGETVTFTSGGVTLGTGSLNGGVATLTTSALAAADHLMVAIYSGDANFKSSQGTDTTEVVNKYPTTTVINSSPNPSTSGQATILTAQVTTSGPSTPTGWVTFRYGTTSLGVAAVNGSGVATLTIKNIPLGSNSLTASYTDSPMYANSVSAPITQIVNQP